MWRRSDAGATALGFAEEKKLATFSLQDDAEFEREEYDRFAFCGWKSKREVFDNALENFRTSERGDYSAKNWRRSWKIPV